MVCGSYYLVLLSLVASAASCEPLVTLSHGGQLQGVHVDIGDKTVDQFLGVPFAQPPSGELQFKKPVPAEAWLGVKKAEELGNSCLQLSMDGQNITGSEDCLYLNIYPPGKVCTDASCKPKSVMVWIHGGGYTADSAAAYMGSVLALHGDVIVIAMNYRLGIFGFFTSGPGTGNYGLWDQREAIIWVKENIAAFGGDPESMTIFGESAGGGSVVGQMLGQHNEGLFQRGIPESGALYVPWSWYTDYNALTEITGHLRDSTGCSPDRDIYECLNNLTGQEILEKVPVTMLDSIWKPVADGDFFPLDVDEEGYNLAQRFDLMAGFNGQEGAAFMPFIIFPAISARNESVDEGCSMEMVTEFLHGFCAHTFTTQAPELCVDFIIGAYDLGKARNGRERAIGLSLLLGELNFDVGMVDIIEKHSRGNKNTYSYYFTKTTGLTEFLGGMGMPDWAIVSANHGEELPFVFGFYDVPDEVINSMKGKGFDHEIVFSLLIEMKKHATQDKRHMSRKVMTMWTNFAKTGNPNLPSKWDEDSTPDWPQFTVSGQEFLELGDEVQVIETPNKERLRQLREVLKPSLKRKYTDTKKKFDQAAKQPDDDGSQRTEEHRDEL